MTSRRSSAPLRDRSQAASALELELRKLRKDVEAQGRRIAALESRLPLAPDAPVISAAIAAVVFGVDKAWMRKLVTMHGLGGKPGSRYEVDVHRFTAFVAVRKPHRMAELERRLGKRV